MSGQARMLRNGSSDDSNSLILPKARADSERAGRAAFEGIHPLGAQALLVVEPGGTIESCTGAARSLLDADDSAPTGCHLTRWLQNLPLRPKTPGYNCAYLALHYPPGGWHAIEAATGIDRIVPLEISCLVVPFGSSARIIMGLRTAPVRDGVDDQFRRFLASVAASTEAVVVTDPAGVVEYVNPAYERLSGWCAADVVGRSRTSTGVPEARSAGDAMAATRCTRAIRTEQTRAGQALYLEEKVRPFTDRGGRVTHYVSVARDLTGCIRAERILQWRADYDCLTGLPNRHMLVNRLHQEIARAARECGSITVICADMDHLKEVNDRHGHAVGDIALRTVAHKLQSCVRDMDIVGRYGGDEFLLIVPGMHRPDDVDGLLAKLVDSVRGLSLGANRPVDVSLSAGAATYPRDARESSRLIDAADSAMYRAKRAGGDRHWEYKPDHPTRLRSRPEAAKLPFIRVWPAPAGGHAHARQPIADWTSDGQP
ncbi:MAG: GGDEF domain-containing protein [Rhodocyclaceae bacterium]|nr:GGDEF domain-containing protein [Rhodocyclaceae bacterium]